MKVYLHLNDKENPMEYTEIEDVIKMEYRYNKSSEQFLVYLETEDSFIAVPIDGIESIEIKEK